MDWFENGYWRIAEPYGNAIETVSQYLDINDRDWDPFTNLNGNAKLEDGIYKVYDPGEKVYHKAVTFEKMKQMHWDIVMPTHPLHGNWEEFAGNAVFIQQLGNENQQTATTNVLSSVYAFQPEDYQKVQFYHQEFDTKEFHYEPPTNHNTVNSFVLGHPERETFEIYSHNLPEMVFDTPKGHLPTLMRESAFGWHIKPWDGYGHVLHNWFASGRPVIVRGDYYKGKTGGLLLEDGVTCIDIDAHEFEENLRLIRYWSEPSNHIRMCQNVRKKFKEVCDFDREEKEIRQFLQQVV